MNDNTYDYVIINNCPSFYKINLYNEVYKKRKIFVVFFGFTDQVVISKDFHKDCYFPYIIINNGDVNKRNKLNTLLRVLKILRAIQFEKIIYGGYIMPELIILSFIFNKHKNILQTESASESKLTGWKFYIKKSIINQFSSALVSGTIHKRVLKELGFKGKIYITKGVGIIKRNNNESRDDNEELSSELKYLYVGRLIKLKNIEFLITIFNKLGKPLTIVGKGKDEDYLKSIAKDNIKFMGFIGNNEIQTIYRSHDVFVLPSVVEPWGLVVEEALYGKCVLLLSNKVGSYPELLSQPNTGEVFDPFSENSFLNAIKKVEQNYITYKKNIENYNLENKDYEQIEAYLNI